MCVVCGVGIFSCKLSYKILYVSCHKEIEVNGKTLTALFNKCLIELSWKTSNLPMSLFGTDQRYEIRQNMIL